MTDVVTQAPAETALEPIYRRNFLWFLIDGILFMVALNMIGATTVIPDFMRNLTNSEILIGISGSIFDVGWTLPQLFVARYIVRATRKKWWFVAPNIPARFIIVIFAGILFFLGKDQPQLILVVFLICYGLLGVGDGLVGVPWADLMGSSLDNRWRARTFGLMSASTGVIMLVMTQLIAYILGNTAWSFPTNYTVLFALSGILFVLSILPGLFIHELPGGKPVEKLTSLSEFLPQLGHVLRTDTPFRALIITRMLTSLFTMAAPFYVGYATTQLGLSSEVAVPNLLAMQTIGNILGALVYTWLGARDNALYIRLALGCAALLPISALVAGVVGPAPLYFGFLMSGLALSNLFFSYQNWVVSHAVPDQRPIYIGLFNTISAVISFAAPFIAGTIVTTSGYSPLFAVAILMVLAAFYMASRYITNPKPQTTSVSG
ncbi:MAG: MFS transporter [Anaerolineae bacterium]|nr:MFS transporter [Anaerolineae bacterium]